MKWRSSALVCNLCDSSVVKRLSLPFVCVRALFAPFFVCWRSRPCSLFPCNYRPPLSMLTRSTPCCAGESTEESSVRTTHSQEARLAQKRVCKRPRRAWGRGPHVDVITTQSIGSRKKEGEGAIVPLQRGCISLPRAALIADMSAVDYVYG